MAADETKHLSYSVLCIEDDEDTCLLMRFVFEQEGFQVETCSVEDCLKVIQKQSFSAIILDNYFGHLSGVEICREIRKLHPVTPIVFFSGEVRPTEKEKALAAGGNAYLIKPDDFEKLIETTLRCIKEART